MSGWAAYIKNLLGSSNCIKRAAIVGLDGAIWARSEGSNEFKVRASVFFFFFFEVYK